MKLRKEVVGVEPDPERCIALSNADTRIARCIARCPMPRPTPDAAQMPAAARRGNNVLNGPNVDWPARAAPPARPQTPGAQM